MNNFGEFLRELRGDKSLRELERLTGVSHTYLSTLEKGVDPRSGKARAPSIDVIKKLSNFYGIPTYKMLVAANLIEEAIAYISKDLVELQLGLENLEEEFNLNSNIRNNTEKNISLKLTRKVLLMRANELLEVYTTKLVNLEQELENSTSNFEQITQELVKTKSQIKSIEKLIDSFITTRSTNKIATELEKIDMEIEDLYSPIKGKSRLFYILDDLLSECPTNTYVNIDDKELLKREIYSVINKYTVDIEND